MVLINAPLLALALSTIGVSAAPNKAGQRQKLRDRMVARNAGPKPAAPFDLLPNHKRQEVSSTTTGTPTLEVSIPSSIFAQATQTAAPGVSKDEWEGFLLWKEIRDLEHFEMQQLGVTPGAMRHHSPKPMKPTPGPKHHRHHMGGGMGGDMLGGGWMGIKHSSVNEKTISVPPGVNTKDWRDYKKLEIYASQDASALANMPFTPLGGFPTSPKGVPPSGSDNSGSGLDAPGGNGTDTGADTGSNNDLGSAAGNGNGTDTGADNDLGSAAGNSNGTDTGSNA